MQDSYITPLKKVANSGTLSLLIKAVLLVSLLTYITVVLFRNQDLAWQFNQVSMNLINKGWSWIYVWLILAIPVNWGLETVKWQTLLRPLTGVSLSQAAKGVLTGLSLGFMTPHSLGDYFGRMAHLGSSQRLASTGAMLLGRGVQFLSTLLFGLVGLWYWCLVEPTSWVWGIFLFTLMALMVMWLMFLRGRKYFVDLCGRFWPAAHRFVEVLSLYSRREIWTVFGLSSLRYVVFASQFAFLLYWLDLPLDLLQIGAGVTWILLAKSVIPAFNFLSDLGVREFSALYFFGLLGVSPAPVLTASLSIWVLNILIPTLVGSIFITQMKLSKF